MAGEQASTILLNDSYACAISTDTWESSTSWTVERTLPNPAIIEPVLSKTQATTGKFQTDWTFRLAPRERKEINMSGISRPVSVQVEYDPNRRRISLNRIFQIPQMFRPAVSSFAGATIGRLNLERPAIGLTAVASWLRFARWRRMHPVERPADGKRRNRVWLYESVIRKESLDSDPIDLWEFGVYRGESLIAWLNRIFHPDSRFVGFDTFTGLPEKWRATELEGAFNVYGKIPETNDPRCSFQVGLFQDTLLPFVSRHDFSRRLVVHLDADLYSSTLFVLTSLARHFKPGDIVFFDNFICSVDEFRAFENFVSAFRVKYEVLGGVQEYLRVCIKIL